jgi:recombination associated protein RdgC
MSRFSSPLGLHMWFKNLQVFRLPAPWKVDVDQLSMQLASQSFSNTGSGDMQSEGWASPRNNDSLVHSVNQQLLLLLQTEKKLLPSSVINQVTKARAKELEEQQGFAPGRKAMKDLKERVTDELLPRAFSITRQTWVWIDPVNGWLVIDSSSPSKADEVIKLLLKCDKIPMESLRTKVSPQTAMTDWLAGNEAPKGFTIDQDTELRAHTEDKATVRYVRHSIDPDDVQRHIAAGKQCTKLAMTWDDKISFVLTENLALKRIKPLDILNEDKDQRTADENERFDADFLLMASELAKMLDDIVYSLGGQLADPLAA